MERTAEHGAPGRTDGPREAPGEAWAAALAPILADICLPLALYQALHAGAGVSPFWSFAASGAVGAVRGGAGLLRHGRPEPLPLLVLVGAAAGMLLSLVGGGERFTLARASFGSGLVGLCALWSAFTTRPVMTQVLRPFLTRGVPGRRAVRDRIAACPRCRQAERRTTRIWGFALTGQCLARTLLALVLPLATTRWLSPVLFAAALVLAGAATAVVAGRLLALLTEMAAAEATGAADAEPRAGSPRRTPAGHAPARGARHIPPEGPGAGGPPVNRPGRSPS